MSDEENKIEVVSEEVPEDTPTDGQLKELGEHSCLLDGAEHPEEAISEDDAGEEAERMETVNSLKELENG